MNRKNKDVTIEYKIEIPKKSSDFKAEIVSFLNTDPGGIIFLGVSDDGNIIESPTEDEEFNKRQKWDSVISNWISEGFAPNVTGLIEIRPNDEAFTIIVNSGPEKPYYYTDGKGMNTKGIYIRSGSSKRRASDEEVRKMIFQSSRKPYDSETSNDQDLTFNDLAKKVNEENISLDIRGLRLKGEFLFNNAALVISDQSHCTTKLAVYNGINTLNFKDKRTFNGSIIRQIDEILNYVKLNNMTNVTITGDARRREQTSYPEEAIREAVINAFAHRDYSLTADIRIEFFNNRVEIHSPGPIPGGLSVDDIKEGSNARRNPTLVHVLDKLGFMENFGSGIRRIYSLYDDFLKLPVIKVTDNSFKITMFNRNFLLNQSDINTDLLLIIDYLNENSNASRLEIQKSSMLSRNKTIRLLNKLILEGIVIKDGSSVSTTYRLK